MPDDTIRQRLEFDADEALAQLQAVEEHAKTAAGKAELLNKKLQDYSRTLGQHWKTTLAQMKEQGDEAGLRFTTPEGLDVTDDVYKQAAAKAKLAEATNKYVTEETKAAAAQHNFDGSVRQANPAIAEQAKKIQALATELAKLKYPTPGRDAQGRFAAATPPSFANQFKSLSTYQEQLKLVETTIASLAKKTNLPFKDVGKELGRSFPELLTDTNLVQVAVENLSKANQGLSNSFKTVKQVATEVDLALTRLQSKGQINLKGAPADVSASLQNTIKQVSAETGATYEQVAAGLQRMGVSAKDAQAALAIVNQEMRNPAAAQYAQNLAVLQGELAALSSKKVGAAGFDTQFKSLSTYQEQLKLVETTIAGLQKKTNLPLKDIGKELGKSFPELLKDTKLVEVAVENLTKANQGLSASFLNEEQAIQQARIELTRMQKEGKINLTGSNQKVVDNLKSVIKEVSTSTGAQFKDVANQLEQMGVPAAQAQAAVRGLNHEMTRGTKEASGFHKGINLLRTALGTLAAVGIFTFLNALQGAFSKIIDNLKETELAVYNLINAERRLSEQGIDITPKGLQETIDSVQKLVPVLTQIQSEELVSRIATNVAPSLKLTNDQIRQMAEATALLYVRNKALGKSFDEVESQLTNAFLTGKVSVGINNLGVKISDQIVKDEALRLDLVKTEKQFDSLSGEMEAQVKAAAMLSIVYKNATEDSQAMGDYLETVDAQSSLLTKTWSDLLTTLGKDAAPVILKFLERAIISLQQMNDWLVRNEETIRQVVALMAGVANAGNEIAKQQAEEPGWAKWVGKFIPAVGALQKMQALSPNDQLKAFSEGYDEAINKAGELADAADTVTANIEGMGAEVDTKGLDELDDKLEEIAIDAEQAREDLDILLAQKQEDLEVKYQLKIEDIDTEYIQKGEDAARDYGQKLVDINLDAQQKIEDAKRKARDDEEKAEAEFLLRMKELRADFILDLEDALHERDARAVLRLIKEYNNDRQKLIDKKALDDRFRKESLDADLKNIEIERQRKIESAGIEYQRKLQQLAQAKQRELEELNIWKAREEAELQKWYIREQEEIDRNTRQKIERLVAGYVEEGKIHESQQGKIHAILTKWFGKNRALVDGLVNYTALKFSEMAATAGAILGAFASMASFMSLGGTQTVANPGYAPISSYGGQQGGGGGASLRFAKGGQFVTTRPQQITVGEGGEPELVQVTPLSKLSSLRDGRRPLNGTDGTDGRNGQTQIVLDMNLSPDLEARVVRKSMDSTADIVEKINRTKS